MNASLKALLNEQYKLVAELREENKKLKEYNGELIENHKKDIAILCEENKKLKSDVDLYKSQRRAYKEKYLALLRANTELDEENRKLREENEMLRCNKGGTPEKVGHEEFIQYLMEENKKQKEENELLKQCLDKLMFDANVVNVKIHGELGDYVYVRSDKQFKLNVKD